MGTQPSCPQEPEPLCAHDCSGENVSALQRFRTRAADQVHHLGARTAAPKKRAMSWETCVMDTFPSPAGWAPPTGSKPGWDWIPPDRGLVPRLNRAVWYIRVAYHLPFLDRLAYEWVWHHGAWDVVTFSEAGGAYASTGPRPRSGSGGARKFGSLPETGEWATTMWTARPRRRPRR